MRGFCIFFFAHAEIQSDTEAVAPIVISDASGPVPSPGWKSHLNPEMLIIIKFEVD